MRVAEQNGETGRMALKSECSHLWRTLKHQGVRDDESCLVRQEETRERRNTAEAYMEHAI